MTPSSVSVPLLSLRHFLPPAEPKEIQTPTDPDLSIHILDSLTLLLKVQPIIRSESHTGYILSKVYQILWTGRAAGETWCATLPLIFCQVIPGPCEWCEAAGRDAVLHFEDPCWEASMLLKCLWAKLWISASSRGFVWLLTLTSDLQKTIYCTYRGHTSNTKTQQYGWYSWGPGPRSAQIWQSRVVDYFQAWHWCQTRVHECIVVTPGDES